MIRQEYNQKIIDILTQTIKKFPDWRFIQILWNLGVITRSKKEEIEDRFYEESSDTYKKIKDSIVNYEDTSYNHATMDNSIDTLISSYEARISLLKQIKEVNLNNEIVKKVMEELSLFH